MAKTSGQEFADSTSSPRRVVSARGPSPRSTGKDFLKMGATLHPF